MNRGTSYDALFPDHISEDELFSDGGGTPATNVGIPPVRQETSWTAAAGPVTPRSATGIANLPKSAQPSQTRKRLAQTFTNAARNIWNSMSSDSEASNVDSSDSDRKNRKKGTGKVVRNTKKARRTHKGRQRGMDISSNDESPSRNYGYENDPPEEPVPVAISVPPPPRQPSPALPPSPSRRLNPVYADRRRKPRENVQLITPEDFEDELNDYIEKQGLERFYAPDDPYIADLARQAAELAQRAGHDLDGATPELYSDMTKIALYNTVMLVDDSGSMHSEESRIPALKEALTRITAIATTFETEGIRILFLNYPERLGSVDDSSGLPIADLTVPIKSVKQIEDIMPTVQFSGGTDIGGILKTKIVEPLLLSHAKSQRLRRPMLCSIITDGEPDSEKEVREAILGAIQGLEDAGYPGTAVGFHITQVGSSSEAETFLDQLAMDDEVGDRIYCTSDKLDEIAEKFAKGDLVGAYNHWWVEQLITAIDPVRPPQRAG